MGVRGGGGWTNNWFCLAPLVLLCKPAMTPAIGEGCECRCRCGCVFEYAQRKQSLWESAPLRVMLSSFFCFLFFLLEDVWACARHRICCQTFFFFLFFALHCGSVRQDVSPATPTRALWERKGIAQSITVRMTVCADVCYLNVDACF